MDQPRADIIKNVLYSASLYFLHSRKKISIVALYKIFISFTIILTLFFLFSLQKDFYIAQEHIGAFCLFLLQKDFGTFHKPFLKAFLRFHDNISVNTLMYREKIYKKIFHQFFYMLLKITLPYELCKLRKLYEYFYESLKTK